MVFSIILLMFVLMRLDTLDEYIEHVLINVPTSVLNTELRFKHKDVIREFLYQLWYKDVNPYLAVLILTTYYRAYYKIFDDGR